MSAKELLPYSSTQVQDAYYTAGSFDPTHSMFAYDGWTTCSNFAFRRRRLDPIGQQLTYGATSVFRLDRSAFLRGPMQLAITRSALAQPSGTVSNTNYNCFVDFEGFAMLEQVEVWDGQTKLQTVTGDDLYNDYLKNKDNQEQIATEYLVNGNLPLNMGAPGGRDRIDMALAPADLFIDLRRLWFTVTPKKYLICTATSNEVEVRVTIRQLNSIVQSTTNQYPTGAMGTAAASITSGQLITFDVAVEPPEMNFLIDQTQTDTGVNYKFNDIEYQNDILVPAGQTAYIISLLNLKGACYSFEFYLRINPNGNISTLNTAQSIQDFNNMPIRRKPPGGVNLRNNAWYGHMDTSYAANPDVNLPQYVGEDVYRTVDVHAITTSDIIVWDWTADAYSRYYIFPLYHRGTVGNSPLYVCPLGLVPGDSSNCSGHKTFSAMINPVLKLNWNTAPVYDQLLNITANVYNNIQYHKNEIFKTFQ